MALSIPSQLPVSPNPHSSLPAVLQLLAALTAAASALLAGAAGHWFWRQRWQQASCEMTYMLPSFHPVVLPPDLDVVPGYSLHRYTDLRHAPGPNDIVTPALFVPGSAGSYEQIRALASETAREWHRLQLPQGPLLRRVHLQWFAINTRAELSALSGAALVRQTRFTLACLRYLNHHYSLKPGRHQGVLLAGHSMGGVVARAALLEAARLQDLAPSLPRPPVPHRLLHPQPAASGRGGPTRGALAGPGRWLQ
ncbi:PGAP1-like protein-domain-containing protein [Haematococcus lacustris]